MITCISFSHNSYLLASQSTDNTILIWHLDTWNPVLVLHTDPSSGKKSSKCLAFHTNRFTLGTRGENNTIRLWNLDLNTILRAAASTIATHYINAKVVLVLDTHRATIRRD